MRKSKIMKKVSLVVRETDLEITTKSLYDLEMIQFFETKHHKLNVISQRELENESEELVKIRTMITSLKPYFTHLNGSYDSNCFEKVKSLVDEKKKLSQQLVQFRDSETREKVKTHLRLTNLNIKKGFIGYISSQNKSLLEDFKKTTDKRLKQYQLKDRIYFYASIEPNFTYKEYFIPLDTHKTESSILLNQKIRHIDKQLTILANSNLRHLQAEELKLSKEIDIEKSKEMFKKTTHHIALQGFVPQDEIHSLDIALQNELADKFILEIEDVDIDKDNVPVLLPNKGIVKSFEGLLSLYALPKYREIDPSILMLIFFPIFFGFVLGDFGYGLTSFIAFSIAKIYLPKIKGMLSIMQLSSVSTMIFGIWYGEYFGFEPKIFPWEFHRSHDPNTLLVIAVIFGIIHINMGLIVGIINNLHSMKKIMCDYVSWMIFQLSLALFYFSGGSGTLFYIAIAFVFIAGFLLYKGHGVGGVIELPSLITNTLSYARLMAVGLSSIVIAVLVNTFSVPLLQSGPIGMVFGVIVFTLGHIFNIILGNFESFLHALRLHYVEFFTKFYEGGGDEFQPFGKRVHHGDE